MFRAKLYSLVSLLLKACSTISSLSLSFMENFLDAEPTTTFDTSTFFNQGLTGNLAQVVSRSASAKRFGVWLSFCRRTRRVLSLPAFINADMYLLTLTDSKSIETLGKILRRQTQKRSSPFPLLDGLHEWLVAASLIDETANSGAITRFRNFVTSWSSDSRTNHWLSGFVTLTKCGLVISNSQTPAFVFVLSLAKPHENFDTPTSKPSMRDESEYSSFKPNVREWGLTCEALPLRSTIRIGGTG